MDFGSPGTNGLKWMTLLCCDMLNPTDITSMANHSRLPGNDYLHLLIGASTTIYGNAALGLYYASNMVVGATIPNSWLGAGRQAFAAAYTNPKNQTIMTNTIKFRVMGYQSCIGDSLYLYNDPDQNTSYQVQDTAVFP
jgi:hypothetical protein